MVLYIAKLSAAYTGYQKYGVLFNKLLKERLKKHDHVEVNHTSGLFKYPNQTVWFTLIVDDVGITYICKYTTLHLTNILKSHDDMETDWTGGLYYGIILKWKYDQGYVDLSMPSYVKKIVIEYEQVPFKQPQYYPYQPDPVKYGNNSDKITPEVEPPRLNKSNTEFVHHVVGSFLYHTHVGDLTILYILSAIASDQANPIERTMKRVHQLLD
jgi:hypothetical protein